MGGGPTGLLASLLLTKYEIDHILVEKREGTLQAPAAHVVNTRTMEIYQQAGLEVEALYGLNTHPVARLIAWKSRLENAPIGVFDAASNRDALMAQSRFSSVHTTNISQHRLEAHLKSEAEKSPYADIRFATEWLGFGADDKSSSLLRTADGSELEVSHTYLLAADGAGSPVARALDIKKIGPDAIATFLNLTCEVNLANRSGDDATLLYWLLEPTVQGTIIVHDPSSLSVYMRPLGPYESIDDYDDERCDRLLKEVFGDEPFKVKHKGIWKMTAQVAEQFRVGPVFLIGDSVHRFPPTGGLGLNTGAGDVHNLVWKIATALKGNLAGGIVEALLASYELERKPVAQRNCDVSKRNNDKMIEVVLALGLDPSKARTVGKVMNSGLVRALPNSLQSAIYKFLTRPVKNILAAAEADNSHGAEVRREVASAIENQREHFSSIGLDLGYVYREGAAVAKEAADTPGSEVSTYTETLGAGARFPNVKLEDGTSLQGKLDYQRFTLFLAKGAAPSDLDTFGVDLQIEQVEDSALDGHAWVLVRPDGHTMAVG